MKRLLSFILILALILSVTACSSDKQNSTDSDDGNNKPAVEALPSLNGLPISMYTIVYDAEGLDYNKRAAEYIRDTLIERFGFDMPIVDDSEPVSEYEIVVGETSRDISRELDAETSGFEFAMLTKGASVALEGEYFVISAAAYFFLDTYLIDADHNFVTEPGVTTHQPITKEAKNYILLIGDGMGVYQTKIFDYLEDTSEYSDGESMFYGYMFPYQGFSRTQSLSGVTDSAAGGTALATGYKTYNEYVGLDKDGNRIKSLTELASELGKATAVMSTENKTGATPASFSAHAYDRDDSSGILKTQSELVSTHGTVIDCGFDYYTARYIKTIEKHITDTLDKVSKDEDGFFLMYEEAHIDKHCHDNDLDQTYLAVIRFNQAIARFMEYAFYNPETMVIITADHETGELHPEDDTLVYNLDDHSASDVPVFAWGMGAEYFGNQTIENIEIAKHIAKEMGVDNFGDPSDEWYSAIYGEDNNEPDGPTEEPEGPTEEPDGPTEEPAEPTTPPSFNVGDTVTSLKMNVYDENGELTLVYDPAENKGKVTVINFWGEWCYYCLKEMPHLDALATELADIVDIVALHTVDANSYNYMMNNYADSDIIFGIDQAVVNGETVNEYFYSVFNGVGYYPYTIFIDPNGEVYYIATGALSYDAFYTYIMAAYSNAS